MPLPAWTLAAFAIGALAGILIRRVIPAMFATLAVWVALAVLTGAYLRPHYEAPLRHPQRQLPLPARLVINQGLFKDGKPASLDMINQTLARDRHPGTDAHAVPPRPLDPAQRRDPVQYLIQHGYTQLTIYQPASRFWPFQWIEGGWLLALSLLLMASDRLARPPPPCVN